MVNRKFIAQPLSNVLLVLSLLGLSSVSIAHDNVAARYTISDNDQTVRYDREVHGDQEPDQLGFEHGWYIALGAGATHLDPENESGGFSTNDDSDSGIKLTFGQQFHPHWGWEYAFLDAGDAGLGNSNPAIADESISYEIHSLFANYYFRDPQADFNFIGKIGISTIRNEASSSTVNFEQQTNAQLAFGAGIHWRFAQRWFLRVEHDRYDRDALYTGASIGIYFGGHDNH